MRLRTVLEALFEWMTAPSLGCGAFIFVTKYTAARRLCISSFIFAIFLSLLFIILIFFLAKRLFCFWDVPVKTLREQSVHHTGSLPALLVLVSDVVYQNLLFLFCFVSFSIISHFDIIIRFS